MFKYLNLFETRLGTVYDFLGYLPNKFCHKLFLFHIFILQIDFLANITVAIFTNRMFGLQIY